MKQICLISLITIFFWRGVLASEPPLDSEWVSEEFIDYKIDQDVTQQMPSYKERRASTGALFSLSYSQFEPLDYQPSSVNETYEELYSDLADGLYEFTASYKWNFAMGSMSLGLGVGMFQALSDINVVDSTLTVVPVRLEATFAFDNLFSEPKIVPYGLAGIYTMYYKEVQAATTYSGTTQASYYFGGGALFQIDWFFEEQAFESYLENGQENTFLYIEGRKFVASDLIPNDPNFETDFLIGGGFKFEY